jgi:hypothetical protein
MFYRYLARNKLHDALIYLESSQIHSRHSVLTSQHLGDLGFLYETEFHQRVAQTHPRVPLFLKGLL